jgi:SAM-dependent methyltransferase
MDQFTSPYQSHLHSLETLNLIYQYDSFLDSLTNIADLGCGAGVDLNWWSTLTTRDEVARPHNYNVYGVDKKLNLEPRFLENDRVFPIEADFEQEGVFSTPVDLIWCHDAFQFVKNPMQTLKNWNKLLVKDGMLVIIMPQLSGYVNNKHSQRVYTGVVHSYNTLNMMYMLALNGFDCKDAYFYRDPLDVINPWIHIAVYKSSDPLDPDTTLLELASQNRLNPSAETCLKKYGHLRQEEIYTTWFDKDWYRLKS